MLYDIIIIGGGPAGVSSAVYAARKQLAVLMITESIGGQSEVSADIENWIGEKNISGFDLAKKFEEHVRAYPDRVKIQMPERVMEVRSIKCQAVEERMCDFEVATDKGNTYEGKTIMLAAGARRRKLGVPGEGTFAGKGVAYCSTCDAPIFKDKTVVVVGGGNAGLESVHDLFPYATKIYLMVRADSLKGDQVTQEKVKANPKAEIIYNAEPQEILGDKFVNTIKYKDKISGTVKDLAVDGVFVEIGSMPNSEIVKGLVNINERGEIIVNHQTQETSSSGIWAVGDVSDVLYKQNNISAGDGTKAVLNIYDHLRKH